MAAEEGSYACEYEVVRDDEIVSTGRLTLPEPPEVGDTIRLGGRALEVVWVGAAGGVTRIRLAE